MNFLFVNKIENMNVPIYLTENYLKILADNDKSAYRILKIILKNGSEIYLSFLIKEIDEDIYEAYSAYGYGGFYSNNCDNVEIKAELISNWEEFNNFMKDNNIIDLFLRNSPFLSNHDFVPKKFNEFNRITFMRKLKPYNNLEEFVKNTKHKLKWSVNSAIKNKLKVEFKRYGDLKKKELLGFFHVYTETMKHKEADDYYFFQPRFFEKHFDLFKDNCELALVTIRGSSEIIGGSIFLLDDLSLVHWHFSAFNRSYSKCHPIDLLLAEAILRYGNTRKTMLHLGGGNSLEGNDGLSKFKSKFATDKLNFYISKIIIDKQKYYKLIKKYQLFNSKIFLIKDNIEYNK